MFLLCFPLTVLEFYLLHVVNDLYVSMSSFFFFVLWYSIMFLFCGCFFFFVYRCPALQTSFWKKTILWIFVPCRNFISFHSSGCVSSGSFTYTTWPWVLCLYNISKNRALCILQICETFFHSFFCLYQFLYLHI